MKMYDRSESDISEWMHLSDFSTSSPTILASINQILVGKVFLGEYVERHYVDSLSTYRDLVVVNSDEIELVKSAAEATGIVRKTYGNSIWFGITDNEHDRTPKGCCLWVNFSQIPLGKHWFQIQSIDIQEREIILKLKHLRLFDSSKNQKSQQEPASAELVENFGAQKFFHELQWSQVRYRGLKTLVDASTWCVLNLRNVLAIENIRETFKFCSVLFLVIVSFLVETSKFLCEYSVKLIRELSNVIQTLTPITLGVIDFFAKCVGGFYLLIVMLWRGSSGPPIPTKALQAAFNRNSGSSTRRAIEYGSQAQNTYSYAQRVPQPQGRFSGY